MREVNDLISADEKTKLEEIDMRVKNGDMDSIANVIKLLSDNNKCVIYKKYKDYFSLNDKLSIISSLPADMAKSEIDELIQSNDSKHAAINKIQYFPIRLTFGIELEFSNLHYNILQNLRESNCEEYICKKLNIQPESISNWEIKKDLSLDEKSGEVASPIFKDDINSWNSINNMCTYLKALGAQINHRCGFHVHFGADVLGLDGKAWDYLLNIWQASENIIYKMGNKQGEPLRDFALIHARSTEEIIKSLKNQEGLNISTAEDLRSLASRYTQNIEKKAGLNLSNIGGDYKNTIEFKISNGTLDINTIIENVRLYAAILCTSKQMSLKKGYKEEEYYKLLSSKTEEEKVKAFLNLIFNNEKDKEIYYGRWNSIKNEQIYEKLYLPSQEISRRLARTQEITRQLARNGADCYLE